ncbi:MAG: hypothetical protein HY661_16205 [Betaproteobacteria bacterium]|nr:hypothetical protein [Betaproteobacteria bacterium]
MLTCKEASRLTSEELDRKLNVGQWLALRMHLKLCQGCTRVSRQLQFLRRAMSQMRDAAAGKDGADGS